MFRSVSVNHPTLEHLIMTSNKIFEYIPKDFISIDCPSLNTLLLHPFTQFKLCQPSSIQILSCQYLPTDWTPEEYNHLIKLRVKEIPKEIIFLNLVVLEIESTSRSPIQLENFPKLEHLSLSGLFGSVIVESNIL